MYVDNINMYIFSLYVCILGFLYAFFLILCNYVLHIYVYVGGKYMYVFYMNVKMYCMCCGRYPILYRSVLRPGIYHRGSQREGLCDGIGPGPCRGQRPPGAA
jgi:hypothetical protein